MMKIQGLTPFEARALVAAPSPASPFAAAGHVDFAVMAELLAGIGVIAESTCSGSKLNTSHTYRTSWNVRLLSRSGAPPGLIPRRATHTIAPEAAGYPGGLFVSRTTSPTFLSLSDLSCLETQQ